MLIEGCTLSSSASDETVLNLHGGCNVTVRRNAICGGETHGVTGISIDGAATVSVLENSIFDNEVGVKLQPSATVTIQGNSIARNQRGVQLNEEGIEAIVDQGGFGRIMLRNTPMPRTATRRMTLPFCRASRCSCTPCCGAFPSQATATRKRN